MRRSSLTKLGLVMILSLVACHGTESHIGPAEPQAATGEITVQASDVTLTPGHPGQVQSGHFRFLRGLDLTSPSTDRFHGLSDMSQLSDGSIEFVSDDGDLFTAHLLLDPSGTLQGLTDVRMHPLRGLDGLPLDGKVRADAEGITHLANGNRLVSFERQHRIWLYPADDKRPRVMPFPPVSPPHNQGIEALAAAPGSAKTAFWAGLESGQVFLCDTDGPCRDRPDAPRPPREYRLTAMAESPDGHIGLLFHRFRPIGGTDINLVIAERNPAGLLDPVDQLNLSSPLDLDNFEGLILQPITNGGLNIYMISDDNFSSQQRTLLFQLVWHADS